MVRFPLGLLVWVACSGEGEVGSTVEQSEEDSGGSSDGGTDSTVAGAQLEPVFSQDGGGFVGDLEVELRPSDGIGEVFACVAVPAESGTCVSVL